jgi:hypothetical protein
MPLRRKYQKLDLDDVLDAAQFVSGSASSYRPPPSSTHSFSGDWSSVIHVGRHKFSHGIDATEHFHASEGRLAIDDDSNRGIDSNSSFNSAFAKFKSTSIDRLNREFPSLGAPSQQQNAPAAQNLWANAPIRNAASQAQSVGQRSGATSANAQSTQDDVSRYLANTEAYRFGGQLSGLGQPSSQNQQGGDEFPPLGGLGVGHVDQRSGLLSSFGAQAGLGLVGSHLSPDQVSDLAMRTNLGDRNVWMVLMTNVC